MNYKNEVSLHQALKNIPDYIPEHVLLDLEVTYRGRDKQVKYWEAS